MKALLCYTKFMCVLTFMFLLTTCSLFDVDDTDLFVGTYSVNVVSSMTWGSGSGTTTSSGLVTIKKESENRIRMSGFMSGSGRVSGNCLYLDPDYQEDVNYGSLNTVYNAGTYSNGIISMTSSTTGKLKDTNGIFYPFSSYDKLTFIKQ